MIFFLIFICDLLVRDDIVDGLFSIIWVALDMMIFGLVMIVGSWWIVEVVVGFREEVVVIVIGDSILEFINNYIK